MDFSLNKIKSIVEQSDFDVVEALQAQKTALQQRADRLARLIETIDKTTLRLKGKLEMSDHELYQGFSDEQQRQYAQGVRLIHAPDEASVPIRADHFGECLAPTAPSLR